MCWALVFASVLGSCAWVGAQEVGQSAAAAFEAGDPAEAARRYEVLRQTRGASADLLYNLGTAYAHADDPGRAIWALESARMMSPRDEALAHNLEVMRQRVRVARLKQKIRSKLTDGEPEGLASRRLLTTFKGLELAIPLVVLNALFFLLLAVRRLMSPSGGRDAVTVMGGLVCVLVVCLAATLVARQVVVSQVRVGVVLDTRVGLSDTPTISAVSRRHVDLYQGAMVRVLEQRGDGWLHLGLVDGAEGWVRDKHVGVID